MKLLYLIQNAVTDSGEDKKLYIFLALYDESNGNLTSVNDVMLDATKFTSLMYAGYDLRFAKLPISPNPIITLGGSYPDGVDAIQITTIYNQISQALNGASQLPKEQSTAIINSLTANIGDEKLAKLIVVCCYAYAKLLTTDYRIIGGYSSDHIMPGFEQQTQAWLSELNRKNTMASIKDNETKFQQACTDELFIKLPAYDAMFNYLSDDDSDNSDGVSASNELRDLHGFMPARSDVSDPYGSKAAMYENPDDVAKMVATDNPVYKLALKEIMGDSNNNTDTIFENEQRYYDSLNKWMSIIATDAEGQDSGDLCSISMEYLHTLVETLYIWYWQHNSRVPCAIDTIASNDTFEESKYTFRSEDHTGNAPEDLISFLDRASADMGREIYAKAAIQLARWGSRKQTAIVFDGYNKCFDLNSGYVKDALPSLSSYDKEQINGKDYAFLGLIKDTTKIADRRIGFDMWPMPIGVVLQQKFSDKSNGESITLESYFSMIDIVHEIVSGNVTVDGIDYVNGEWHVADSTRDINIDEVLEIAKLPDRLQFPIFRGTGLIQIYSNLRISTPSNADTHFSIMCSKLQNSRLLETIDNCEFDTYAGFDKVTKDGRPGRKQATDYMIVRDLLEVFHFAAINWQEGMSNSDTLKLWHTAILECGYVNESYFYKGDSEHATPLPGCKVENFQKHFWRNDIPNSQSSSDPKKIEVDTAGSNAESHIPTVNFESAILMTPSADCSYCQFVNDDSVVCTCAISKRTKRDKQGNEKPNDIFIVLDPVTIQSLNIPENIPQFPVSKLLTHMCKVFYAMSRNLPMASNLRFESSNAIKMLHKYFQQF